MASTYDAALDEIFIFRDLTADERAVVARACRWRRIKANERVVGHLEDTTDVFFVVQGHLRAMISSLSGKSVTFYDVGPGEIFGEFAAIDGATRSADVYGLDDAFIGSMAAGEFQRMLQKYPAVAMAVCKRLVRVIRELNERVFEYSALSVNHRIHAELLRHAFSSGIDGNKARIEPSPTHADIASRVSTTREAVTRELNALARSGVLTKQKNVLIINDVSLLHEELTGEMGKIDLSRVL